MLTSLRSDIAETLEALAGRQSFHGNGAARWAWLIDSARTLRWVDAFEAIPDAAELADAEALQERLDEIDHLLTYVNANGKPYTLAQLRKEIEAVLSR